MRRIVMLAVLLGAFVCQAAETPAVPEEAKGEKDARMKWFREARFGMFIHWGVYSVPAGEWQDKKTYGEWFLEETKMPVSQYVKYAKEFNPVKFDAKEWVRIAKDAGMKYMVITSKHHDGFGMFRSELTDWCIKSTPFQRDPIKELADACKEAGITFCFYHSIMDWHHPDWGQRRAWNDLAKDKGEPDMDRYTDYMKGQLKELLTKYGPIGIVWFDGEWEKPWTHERGIDLYNYCRSLQPNTIVNNRVGKGRAGMSGMDKDKGVGDYGTPEQEIPPTGFGEGVDWESCMTMNGHWGYNKYDQNWKSTENLVRNLIDCASKGGNYLLNVGPTSEGLIPGPSVERLAEMGKWIKVNGESIYGTKASPFKHLKWGRCTQRPFDSAQGRPGKLYLHVFDWPADGRLLVPGLKNKVNKAYLLCDAAQSLAVADEANSKIVTVGGKAPDSIASVVVLEIEGKADVVTDYKWQRDEGMLALVNGNQVLWQLNFKKEEGKPYFHPLNLADGTTITELRPADHVWHRGLWWSWKYINKVNYWEENKKTGLCDGRTEMAGAKVNVGKDFSANVELALNYHLPDKAPLLTEKRQIRVSTPDDKGNYSIDWTATFTAGSEDLNFDRTPPKNFSGGYAGLSCRMGKELKKWTYTACDGTTGATNIYGKTHKWLDFSKGGGITIFDHPSNMRHPTTWYPNGMPFFSPAIIFHEPYTLQAGKAMTLRYRVFVHSAPADRGMLEAEWKKFAGVEL